MQAEIPVQDPKAPVKNEEIFLPFESHAKLLTWLKRLSVLAIPLALYQISAGFFFTSQHPSSLNSSLSFAGIFSFAFLSFVLYWTFITTRKEEKIHSIYPQTRDHLSSFALLITSFIKIAQVPVLLTNLYFQQEYIYNLIGADKSIKSSWEVVGQPSSGFMNGMMKAYAVTELIFFAYSLLTVISLMKYSLKPKKLCSVFIFVFNAIMLGASLSLAFTAYRAWTPQNYPRFNSLFPESTLASLLGVGVVGTLSSLPIWLINHKKWRVGFCVGFFLTLLTSVSLFGLSNSAYSHTQNIYQTYKDTENSREWSLNMGLVSQKEIEAAGCPSKYVSPYYCENDSIISAWESASTNGIRPYCLNKQCAGILGQLYSDQFLDISNWSLMTAISSALVGMGMLYSMKTRGRSDSSKQRKEGRHKKWLFTLGAVALCVTLVYGFTPNYSIEEFKDSQNYSDQANSGEADYLNWISAANNVMNKAGLIQNNGNVEYLITQMLSARSDRFLIMKQDLETNKLALEKKGGKDQTYQQFLVSLSPVDAQIALVQIPIDNKEMLIEVIWTPEDGSTERNNGILSQYAKDNRGCFYNENLKMMVVTASKLEDLSLSRLYQELPSLGQLKEAYKGVSDEIIERTDKLISYITRRVQSDLTLEAQSAEDIVSMIRDRKFKSLSFELNEDSETIAISQRGNWESDFNDFAKNLNSEKPQIVLTFLRLDGTVRLVEILYMPESATPLEKQLFIEYYANKELTEAKEVGLETYVARKAEELEFQMILKYLYPMNESASEERNVIDLIKTSSTLVSKEEEYIIGDDLKSEFERFLSQEEGQMRYKYAVFKWNNEKEMGVERIGALWKNYYQFLYDLPTSTAISPRVAFYNVEIETGSYPIVILWLPKCHLGDDSLKQNFKLFVEEFEGKTTGFIMTGEPKQGIEEILSHLADSNEIKSTGELIDENAPNIIYMKSPSMLPRGVTFLKSLEDWDDQLSLQEGYPMNIDMPGTPRVDDSAIEASSRMLEVDTADRRRLENIPLDFLRTPGAWAPPASYILYESDLGELRVPDLDSMRAKSSLAPPSEVDLRSKSALVPPAELDLKAKGSLSPPSEVDLRAKSALTPPVTDLKAKGSLSPPSELELRAKGAMTPPAELDLKAKGPLSPPSELDLRAKSALTPPVTDLKAKGSLSPPSELDLRAKSALAPPVTDLKAKGSLSPPTELELRAKGALTPPVKLDLKAKGSLSPPSELDLRAKSSLRPPSDYLKISQPLNPPLSSLRSSGSSSNDLLTFFGASSSPPKYMLKSQNAFPSSSDLTSLRQQPVLSQSNHDQGTSQQRSLGEAAFRYSPLAFFRTFELTELFDFFDDFSLNQTFKNNIQVAEGVNVTIQDMIQTHKYSYIILGLDASSTNLSIIEKGKAANSYEAFLTKFNKDKSQIAIVDLSVENTSKFVLILYVPESASQSEKDVFNNYIIPQASLFTKNQGVPVLIAHTSRDVKLANILKYAFSLPQEKSTNTTQPTLLRRRGIQGSQQRISPIVFHLKTQYIAGDVETVLNEVIVGRKYKYILLDWNTTTQLLQVTKKASINTNYEQFLKEFQPGKSRLALLDFGYEGKDIPVLISWGSELIYSQPWQAQAYQLILTEATNLNIPYYEPRELISLQLPNLVDYLFTFWPLQINSYTKYTSNQLLSVLQSSPDSATLESILQPVYSNNVTSKGESVLTEMLLRRKYKYLLFKEVEEAGENKLLFVKTAPQTSTTQDFLNDTKGNGNQLALLYLEFAGQDRIVALVMTDPGTLEKNYINYARIASAAEVYDIPTAYVSSPEALDIEQLTQFTFADDILRILETLKVDPGVQDHWAAAQNGTTKGYVTITLQDGNSHIKIEKSDLGDQVTYADFQKELSTTKPFWAILNTADMNEKVGSSKPRLISWIPAGSDMPSKILYKNAENILVTSLPGSKVYSNPDLIPN